MKGLKIGLVVAVIGVSLMWSCKSDHQLQNEDIVLKNDFLIGSWEGTGGFLDHDFSRQMGDVPIAVTISENGKIKAKIGDAELENIHIVPAKYGFEIRGELDGAINENDALQKTKLVILLVEPTQGDVLYSDANFHLKSNYLFDVNMKVGGVKLTKR